MSNNSVVDRLRGPVKRLATNPTYVVMRLLGRFHVVRQVVAMTGGRGGSNGATGGPTMFPAVDVNDAAETLNQDGLFLGLTLPPAVVDEIRTFALTTDCYANGKTNLGFRYADREKAQSVVPGTTFLTGHLFNLGSGCTAIRALEHDPTLLAIARTYLRRDPVHKATTMWWSFAVDASDADRNAAAQMYHFDVDDYRFVKFFFYLTDADPASGPHVCVRGTHDRKKLRHQWRQKRYADDEIVRTYGAENVVTICGPAGYGFAEDTMCFHKGAPPQSRDRLVLQLEYGRHDFGLHHDQRSPAELQRLAYQPMPRA